MKKCVWALILVFTFIQGYVFAACASSGNAVADHYREKDKAGNGKDSLSEQKSDKEIKREFIKDITKRRKAGEVIPWTALKSFDLKYENAVDSNNNKEHKGDSMQHPERIALIGDCSNQTEFPISAMLLHIKLSDETGAVVSEGDVKTEAALAAWETKKIHAVCVEATSKETSELLGRIKQTLNGKSGKIEVDIKQILWKNGKVTSNTP
jgi:hypothetical protein